MRLSDLGGLAMVFGLAFGIASVTSCLMGCSPAGARRAATAAELAAYGAALERCYATTAGMPYDAYEACARDADRKFGVTHDPR